LQGETGKKYLVSFQLGPKNRRTRYYFLSLRCHPTLFPFLGGKFSLKIANFSATKGQVATTTEENLERLADAGFLVEDLIPVCFNCNTKGHGKSECPAPPEGIVPHSSHHFYSYLPFFFLSCPRLIGEFTRNTPVVSCINCGEEGHRMRDCPQERKEGGGDLTCRNCEYNSIVPLVRFDFSLLSSL